MNYSIKFCTQVLFDNARAFLRGCLLVCLFVMSPWASAVQQETTVVCSQGDTVGIAYGDSTQGCSIQDATATNRFTFSGTANDLVRFNLATTTNAWNPVLEVRDDTNTIIGSGSCTPDNSISTCSFSLDVTLPRNGVYLVIIADGGADQAGNYQLSLERLWPSPSVTYLDYDVANIDAISPSTDIDHFHFNATSGTSLRLNVVTTTNAWNPRVELRGPDGPIVINGIADGAGCNPANIISTCSFSVDWVPPASGTYYLSIYDDGTNQAGGYQVSLLCLYGACDNAPVPDPTGPVINYIQATTDTITPAVDADAYTFNATASTLLRLNLRTTSNAWNPRVELRDTAGTVVLNGIADGAGCNPANISSTCSFSVELVPALSGTYSLLVYDDGTNQTGGYQIGLWCVLGDCDSDGDAFPDNDRQILNYGGTITSNAIDTGVDADYYLFNGTVGDEIQFNFATTTNAWNPRLELRDPTGTVVLNGLADGMGCNPANIISTCSFIVNYSPPLSGTYSLLVYDGSTDQAGNYNFTLACVFGTGPGFTCTDLTPTPGACADNCSVVENADQSDSNGDGIGNICDADLDNVIPYTVNLSDYSLFRSVFGTTDPDADFNGDGIVNLSDYSIFRRSFGKAPGPSCAIPNTP